MAYDPWAVVDTQPIGGSSSASPATSAPSPAAPSPDDPSKPIADAIHAQERPGKGMSSTSIDGAKGDWQITPATFDFHALPGEDISNPADNERVGRRIISQYYDRYNGDPARVATAYFSGAGNVAPPESGTPFLADHKDGNGKSVSSYVADIQKRLGAQQQTAQAGAAQKPATAEGTAPAAKDAPAKPDPWAVVSMEDAPKEAAPVKDPGFPYDKPGTYYGDVLPLARDEATGSTSLAVPEMIRAPVRGLISMGKRATGTMPLATEGAPAPESNLSPDENAALMATIGTKAGGMGDEGLVPRPAAKAAPEAPTAGVRLGAPEARDAGYVLPPTMALEQPGTISGALSGWGGKIKTQQLASVKNQEVTNQLAAQSLGLPPETTLTDKAIAGVRAEAGKSYEAVASAIPEVAADDEFRQTVSELGGRSSQAAQYFPNLMKNEGITTLVDELGQADRFPPQAGLELVKELRANATANLKAIGDPGKHALGLAQRQGADAIDSLIERNIADAGSPDLVEQYRDARKLIAKSYDVEGATNTATGDVSARGLGRLSNKGRPLSGELETIANTANAFPKAMQNPANFGGSEDWSALDFFGSAAALAAQGAHGIPVAAAIMARPVIRRVILSKPYQNRMIGKTKRGAASADDLAGDVDNEAPAVPHPGEPTAAPAPPTPEDETAAWGRAAERQRDEFLRQKAAGQGRGRLDTGKSRGGHVGTGPGRVSGAASKESDRGRGPAYLTGDQGFPATRAPGGGIIGAPSVPRALGIAPAHFNIIPRGAGIVPHFRPPRVGRGIF